MDNFIFCAVSISRIPTSISQISILIPRISTLILGSPTQIPRIPTSITCITTHTPRIHLIPFRDSPFRLLQTSRSKGIKTVNRKREQFRNK